LRWILCGKNDTAVLALEHLLARGDEVFAIGIHGDGGEDGWQRSFARAARRLGVRLEQPRSINAPEQARRLAAFGARALISIQYDQILRAPLLHTLGHPCLNLHFSLLPRHRGVYPIAWAILAGDREAGVTLHHLIAAIDAGDLLAQKRVPIGDEDTARELYDRVSRAAIELFRECHPFDDALLAARLPQDPTVASYHRATDLDFSQRRIDWRRPAAELQRWLRALIFPPFQHPEARGAGRVLRVTWAGSEVGPAAGAAPGTLVERRGPRVRVACADGTLWIRGLLEAGPAGGAAQDLAGALDVGSRLE
jgi:methionyl-tRNA formyltransferase